MAEIVAGWIFGIWGIICIMDIVVWNAVRLIKAIQCRKIKYPCQDMQCRWRHTCDKYDNQVELLKFRIEILREQIRCDEMKQLKN